MTDQEKNILDVTQKYFPLAERPYFEIAESLKMTESEVIKKLKKLKLRGYIKYIGAIMNTAALNFESALVAFYVSPEKIADAVKIINPHPGVSHNYLRDSKEYNIWFTIAVTKGTGLTKTIEQLARLCSAKKYLVLPSIKTYKVKMVLDISDTPDQDIRSGAQKNTKHFSPKKLSADQKVLLSYLQYGLPLVSEPFKNIAKEIGWPVSRVLKISNDLLENGVIKRFTTLVSHTKTGYKFNALVLWKAASNKIDISGRILASNRNVSHCYRRRAYPRWPYSIYTMVHAKTEKEFQFLIHDLAKQTKLKEYKILRSKKEYKKQRLLYFEKRI